MDRIIMKNILHNFYESRWLNGHCLIVSSTKIQALILTGVKQDDAGDLQLYYYNISPD